MRVLVVEDEITLNKLISQKLKTQGYSVDSCFGGSLALDYLLVTEYDVIGYFVVKINWTTSIRNYVK